MDLIAIKIPNNLKTELSGRPPSRWETDPNSTTKSLKTELIMDPLSDPLSDRWQARTCSLNLTKEIDAKTKINSP